MTTPTVPNLPPSPSSAPAQSSSSIPTHATQDELTPTAAMSKVLRGQALPIWSSDKKFAYDDSNFPPDTPEDIWTVDKYREKLGDSAKTLHEITVENRTLDMTLIKPDDSLEGQRLVTRGRFDSKGDPMFEHVAPAQGKRFCACDLRCAAMNDGTDPKASIEDKKDGRRLLNVLENWVEGSAFCFFEPDVEFCGNCGMPELADVTPYREPRDLYSSDQEAE